MSRHKRFNKKNFTPKNKRDDQKEEKLKKFYPFLEDIVPLLESTKSFLNFGLYFNKYLWVTEGGLDYKFQAKPKVKRLSKKQEKDLYQVDDLLERYKECSSKLEKYLKNKHREINDVCKSFQNLEYNTLVDERYELQTPLIIGLGNAHPTERGFTFHWTLGLPYIPAESIKGVVRLAYLVNQAEENPEFFEHWAKEDEAFWDRLADPFGRTGDENKAQRGKVVFLDAFPVEPPKLTLEITSCHYPEYYSGSRGPTEDQNPNPLPFLAVAPGSRFRFVLLLHEDLKKDIQEKLKLAFRSALTEHGFGAKTALGHGRFKP